MITDLFTDIECLRPTREPMGDGAYLLRRWALSLDDDLLCTVEAVATCAPFRRMMTPGGFMMSVAMTNCGAVGWVSDRTGYRYDAHDPETGRPWPTMPVVFARLAATAATECGYSDFNPNACLINRYEPGARLSLHQDKDESDLASPIVSVSLGLPATFQFGGRNRSDPLTRHILQHGDVAVWGGRTRLNYHGVLSLTEGCHAKTGRARINLTFRHAVLAPQSN